MVVDILSTNVNIIRLRKDFGSEICVIAVYVISQHSNIIITRFIFHLLKCGIHCFAIRRTFAYLVYLYMLGSYTKYCFIRYDITLLIFLTYILIQHESSVRPQMLSINAYLDRQHLVIRSRLRPPVRYLQKQSCVLTFLPMFNSRNCAYSANLAQPWRARMSATARCSTGGLRHLQQTIAGFYRSLNKQPLATC